jgi:hypothetical protein
MKKIECTKRIAQLAALIIEKIGDSIQGKASFHGMYQIKRRK